MADLNEAVPTTTEKSATVKINLKADSGYTTQETCRISIEQWTEIQTILHDEAGARMCAAAPELFDACNVAMGHLTGGMDGDWRDCDPVALLRAALAKATEES